VPDNCETRVYLLWAIGVGIAWQLVGGLSMHYEYDYNKYANIACHSGRVLLPSVSRQRFNACDKLSARQFLLG